MTDPKEQLLANVRGSFLQYSKNLQSLLSFVRSWEDENMAQMCLESLGDALNNYAGCMYELGEFDGHTDENSITTTSIVKSDGVE